MSTYVVQEEAGVNHTAAKIIDSIATRPGVHAAVCPVSFTMLNSFFIFSMFFCSFTKHHLQKFLLSDF